MSRKSGNFVLASAQVVTANAVQNQAVVPSEGFDEALIGLVVTATGGTTPTVTPTIEVSLDGGATWFTHTAFAAITADGSALQKITNIGGLLRLNFLAVGGTTPTFTINARAACKKLAN